MDRQEKREEKGALLRPPAMDTQERPGDQEFLFIGGVLPIDFVNTEIVVRGKRRDLLVAPEAVIRWWQAARLHHPDADVVQVTGAELSADPELLMAAKALRTTLRQMLSRLVEQRDVSDQDLADLNGILKLGYPALERAPRALEAVYHATETRYASLLLPIALSMRWLLSEANLDRIHQCRNPRCILFFYDETRSATRHWCSLGCMNRARSIQRYHQAKVERALRDLKHDV